MAFVFMSKMLSSSTVLSRRGLGLSLRSLLFLPSFPYFQLHFLSVLFPGYQGEVDVAINRVGDDINPVVLSLKLDDFLKSTESFPIWQPR
jgi:hypothetical protein